MISREELQEAIRECEAMPETYQNCEKLATFFAIYDHLYGEARPAVETVEESVIGNYGDSEFFRKISGQDAAKIWAEVNGLLDALQALNPQLYKNFMNRI